MRHCPPTPRAQLRQRPKRGAGHIHLSRRRIARRISLHIFTYLHISSHIFTYLHISSHIFRSLLLFIFSRPPGQALLRRKAAYQAPERDAAESDRFQRMWAEAAGLCCSSRCLSYLKPTSSRRGFGGFEKLKVAVVGTWCNDSWEVTSVAVCATPRVSQRRRQSLSTGPSKARPQVCSHPTISRETNRQSPSRKI